ncbi:hypothetical protein TWF696_009757 [Orbilia brochopaga]|uniref:Uncharacterized protein n=1 Tax=Orbilia brochopaga TaxID=3140254 RepID=A0AAV9UDR1_9PEZI
MLTAPTKVKAQQLYSRYPKPIPNPVLKKPDDIIIAKMQLSKLACLLPLFTMALAATVPQAEPVAEVETLDKRACKYNGCRCASSAKGVYCGGCGGVTNLGSGGAWGHVYQCNGAKSCCDYGPRKSCDSFTSFSPCG